MPINEHQIAYPGNIGNMVTIAEKSPRREHPEVTLLPMLPGVSLPLAGSAFNGPDIPNVPPSASRAKADFGEYDHWSTYARLRECRRSSYRCATKKRRIAPEAALLCEVCSCPA